MMLSLPEIARAVRGQVAGRQVLAPGPLHSHRDRSLSIRLSDASPDGFVVHSHAGDDWRDCRDHVAQALGLPRDRWREQREPDPKAIELRRRARLRAAECERAEAERKRRRAVAIWNAGREPSGTFVESYLNSRGLDLPGDVAGRVIRLHHHCPWENGTVPAMIAAIRSVESGQIIGIHRTRLDEQGRKLGRKVYGSAGGGAIMLSARQTLDGELIAGEGIETAMTARQIGLGPAWSLISAGNIGMLPVLDGVQALTVLAEIDKTPQRASAKAFAQVAERWHAAGRRVDRLWPPIGCGDLNDAIRRDR